MSSTIISSVQEVNPYGIFLKTQRQRVSDGQITSILEDGQSANYILVLVLPQLGDFDSLEYAWWLQRQAHLLQDNNIMLRAIAIGDLQSGRKFCQYTGFAPENLFIDPKASIHQELNLYQGLNWRLPGFSSRQNAWLNLLLMCAGIGSPGTLKEVFRGYIGDRQAPSLLKDNEKVQINFLPIIKGSLFNKLGQNYQRPFELATLRLQNMVEVLTHWRTYVPDEKYLTQRGGTFLFNSQGELIYEHRDRGILGFADNMTNPLHFLQLP